MGETMFRNITHSIGFAIRATDGEIGKVADFYFDDENWAIRYLVVNTGDWLGDRLVLVSPIAIGGMDWEGKRLDVRLTKSQVEKSPNIDTRKTVSRQHETEYLSHYGYPSYWDGPYLWGRAQQPSSLFLNAVEATAASPSESSESHLRGTHEVGGYHIEGTDGQIGHVQDFIVDDETWAIRYLVVNTSNWWLGRKVLVAPAWIERVSWPDSKVHVSMSLSTIKNSPEYDDSMPIPREYEQRLYDYHRRAAYWFPKVS
jgi:sporulation protein YlmC with PRC-barrel domain